jgi:hypothetical protein
VNALRFACRFVSLPLPGPLADDQDAFLGMINNRWVYAHSGSHRRP